MNENIRKHAMDVSVKEGQNPIYSSRFLMDKALFYDFCSVSYNRTKKVFLVYLFLFLFLAAFVTGINLSTGNYGFIFWCGLFISFLMVLIYFKINRNIKIEYERGVLINGGDNTIHYELFEDKIVSKREGLKREYFYYQVTGLFETNNFILLHLKHNLHVTINKDNLDANVDEVKSFLLKKCVAVDKKKFIDCCHDKQWSVVLLVLLCVVCVIASIAALVLSQNGIV